MKCELVCKTFKYSKIFSVKCQECNDTVSLIYLFFYIMYTWHKQDVSIVSIVFTTTVMDFNERYLSILKDIVKLK